jgi:hypothetical protein
MGPGERSATSVSPRRRPMISSVSVVRAWKRHVSHTSSLILTEVRDISAAGRGRRRSAGVSGRPVAWLVRVSPLLSVPRTFLGTGTALRRVASRRLPWLLLRAWARDTLSGVGCGVGCGVPAAEQEARRLMWARAAALQIGSSWTGPLKSFCYLGPLKTHCGLRDEISRIYLDLG